jgi:hypothetical protein
MACLFKDTVWKGNIVPFIFTPKKIIRILLTNNIINVVDIFATVIEINWGSSPTSNICNSQ